MASDFNVSIKQSPDRVTLAVAGEVDLATVESLAEALERALAEEPSRVFIDLRAVTFMDSSGLKFLLEAHRSSQRDGWRLEIGPPPDEVREVFKLTGIDERLPFSEG